MRHLALVCLCLFVTAAAALEIGDKAPKLAAVSWVKGEAPAESGKITVVEFWATWCGPCRVSIPHLSELQKRYGDKIQILGISTEDEKTVRPFVDKQPAMDYRVGIIAQDKEPGYMEGVEGIPHAVLVDANGVVMWIGHPMTLDGPLSRLVAGKYDLELVKKIAVLEKQLEGMIQRQDPKLDAAVLKTAEILTLDPLNEQAIGLRIALAEHLGKPDLVRATLEGVPLADISATQACDLAHDRLTAEKLGSRNPDLALAFAKRAKELDAANPKVLATYALALATIGLIDEAIAEQEAAVKLAPQDVEQLEALAYLKRIKLVREKMGK